MSNDGPHDLDLPGGWDLSHVTSADDPRVDDFRRLTDMEWRTSTEARDGYFVAEGALVIERVADLDMIVRGVLTTRKWLPRLAVALGEWRGPVYVVDDEVAQEITGYHVHRGALAAVERPIATPLSQLLAHGGDLIVLEDLVDHTNVGLVFRSALALGIRGVVLSPRCADPLYRRAVKSSMGAVLSMPWTRIDERSGTWPAPILGLAEAGISLLGLSPRDSAVELAEGLAGRQHERVALVVGSEGPGLSAQALRACEATVRIPMADGVDSLNAAAATAVACYALRMSHATGRP